MNFGASNYKNSSLRELNFLKEVNFDLNMVVNPHVGIAVYATEIITRLVKHYNDYKYVGTVCIGREGKQNLKNLNIPVRVALSPYGMTFNRGTMRHILYNLPAHSFSDIYIFWGNSIPVFPIKGKIITAIHDLTPLYTIRDLGLIQRYKQIINRCLNQSDYIITVSKYSENDIREKFGYQKNNIKIVYSASDFDRFNCIVSDQNKQSVRNKYMLPEKYMLYIGNTYEYKNIKGIIDAVSILPNEIRKQYKFVCANTAEYLIQYAIKKHVIDNVIFLNGIDEYDKPAVYQMAALTFLVSYNEGFGTPIVESMAAGTPVITSNLSCMPEISGDAAVMVSPDNYEDIASAIERVLNDFSLRKNLIQKGYINAKRYSWDTSAEELHDILKELS